MRERASRPAGILTCVVRALGGSSLNIPASLFKATTHNKLRAGDVQCFPTTALGALLISRGLVTSTVQWTPTTMEKENGEKAYSTLRHKDNVHYVAATNAPTHTHAQTRSHARTDSQPARHIRIDGLSLRLSQLRRARSLENRGRAASLVPLIRLLSRLGVASLRSKGITNEKARPGPDRYADGRWRTAVVRPNTPSDVS